MNKKLVYFISSGSMFGIGFYIMLQTNGKNSYISLALGTILGIAILYIYSLFNKCLNNKKLKDVLPNSFLGVLFKIILIMFYITIITIVLLVLATFVNSFYLVRTPIYIVLLFFGLLSVYLVSKEEYVFFSISSILYYLNILVVVLFALGLTPYMKVSELMPWFNFNSLSIIKGSIIYALITTVPTILVIDYNYKFKDVLKEYLGASLINFIIIISIILSLGSPLIKVYKFPEYDALKQIKILDFIENIENISAINWYLSLFMILSVAIHDIKRITPKKHNKIYLFLLLLVPFLLTINIFYKNYIKTIYLVNYYPLTLFIFFILFILLFIYIKIKKE
jgi:spore germination protein KB